MNEKVCIVIPIQSINLNDIKAKINSALEYSPEFIEFRFDFLPNVEDLANTFIQQIKSFLKRDTYSIFTFRHVSEGGKVSIKDSSRFHILKSLIEQKPDFFDIEMNSSNQLLSDIINLCYMNKVNMILSYHNFLSTPSLEQAKETILRFEERIVENKLDEFDILSKSIYKIIFTAQKVEDNLIPFKLCQEFSKSYKKIISFCMGDIGILSRLFCIKLGSTMTYASLDEETASGQINIKTFQHLYEFMFSD
ncbi:MAG: type I 3-dehydroquinate dehydratase [Candidatus Hermodarchaeota archaeon]